MQSKKRFKSLSKAEQQLVNAEFPKLNKAFESALMHVASKSKPVVFARLKAAVALRMKEILEVARSGR